MRLEWRFRKSPVFSDIISPEKQTAIIPSSQHVLNCTPIWQDIKFCNQFSHLCNVFIRLIMEDRYQYELNIHHIAKTSITITILFILRFGDLSKILTIFYIYLFVCFALYSMYVFYFIQCLNFLRIILVYLFLCLFSTSGL